MTISLLRYSFADYWLPPEPPSETDGRRRPKPSRPLPPEARWLLWQWSRVIGLAERTTCHVQTLCQRLGTTPHQWSRIMGMLKASGVMVTCPVPQKRGRPLTEYHTAADLRYDLGRLAVLGMLHHREIEHVLGGSAPSPSASEAQPPCDASNPNLLSPDERRCRLTPANRWLIAVLLAHADDAGRVTGLSYTRLGQLTGMSRNQLQSQIPKLRSQGVLAYHQPGQLGRLCGCQMTSTFVLDLDHRLIRSESRSEVSVTMYSARNGKQQLRTVVNSLMEALFVVARYQVQATDTARRAESPETAEQDERTVADALALLPVAFDPGPLASQLARAYDADSANWLQVRLHGYAEQLLTHGWDALSAGQGGPDHPVDKVIDAVARDFPEGLESPNQEGSSEPISEGTASAQSDAGLIQADSVTEADDSHAPHVILLYALAHHLAVQLQPWLIRITREQEGVRLHELSFSLTPDPLHGLSRLKVQGLGKRSSDHRRPTSDVVMLDPAVRSDMTAWLSQHRDLGDSPSQAPVRRKRFGRRFRPASK